MNVHLDWGAISSSLQIFLHRCAASTLAFYNWCSAIDPNKLSAWAAVAGAALALIALLVEAKRSRFQAGVELLLKFNDDFDSDRMKRVRKAAAEAIRKNKADGVSTMGDVDDVLDFFETISLLVRRNAVDKEFTWHTFYYWLHRYCIICASYIMAEQKSDHARWEDLCWLHTQLSRIDKVRNGSIESASTDDVDLMKFIEDELAQ